LSRNNKCFIKNLTKSISQSEPVISISQSEPAISISQSEPAISSGISLGIGRNSVA